MKSGKNYHRHSSLDAAMERYPDMVGEAIVLSAGNVEKVGKVQYLPLYMLNFMEF